MTVETRDIWDLDQELPGAFLHFGHAESTRVTNGGAKSSGAF
jgi:hypothetical protein